MIGAYGTGYMPIIGGLTVMAGSDGLTVRNVHLLAASKTGTGWDGVVYTHQTTSPTVYCNNVTVAFCRVQGKHVLSNYYNPTPYPFYGFRTHCHNMTVFNCIIEDIWQNAHDDGTGDGNKYIRNWVRNVNRQDERALSEGWPSSTSSDPWAYEVYGQSSVGGWGDGFLSVSAINNYYFAGNLYDRTNSRWKFCWITNAGWASASTGLIAEHNTFRTPKSGLGGGGVYWNTPDDSIFRSNLVDRTNKGDAFFTGVTLMASTSTNIRDHLQLNEPAGIHYNHFVKKASGESFSYPDYPADLKPSNTIFSTWSAYNSYITSNPGNYVGSDIDETNFFEPITDGVTTYNDTY